MYSLQCSPDNIRWKVWIIASRIVFRMGDIEQARQIIERCCQEAPPKQVSMALLEYAKHFETRGMNDRAHQIMASTKRLIKNEWKIYFEAVMLELRSGDFKNAE